MGPFHFGKSLPKPSRSRAWDHHIAEIAGVGTTRDKEFVLLSIEWPAGVTTAAHTHLGDEYGLVIEGSYSVKQGDGEWKTINAGESWHAPAGVVHESKPAPTAKTINAFVVERGKPLINPFKKP